MPKLFFVLILAEILILSVIETTTLLQISDKYYVSESNETFLHAWVECKANGLELAVINNVTENSNLTSYLSLIGTNRANCYWIGGVRLNNGAWVWVDSARPITYTNWGANEPTATGSDDYCLQFGMSYGELNPNGWEAQTCSTLRYYICQK